MNDVIVFHDVVDEHFCVLLLTLLLCCLSVTYVTSRERKLTIELGLSGFKID